MKYLESVEEARYFVEEASKKLDLEKIGENLDAAKEQEDADCEDLVEEAHPDYAYIDTDHVEIIDETSWG